MTKIICSALFVMLTSSAYAVTPVRPLSTPVGRMQSQLHLFTQKSLGPKGYLKKDQIGGCCTLLGTTARIENLDGKVVSETKIETIDTFTLTGLQPSMPYNVIFIHPRYKTPLKLEKVVSGNWVNFKSP